MRGIIVTELELSDDIDIGAVQLAEVVRVLKEHQTEQMVDDVLIAINSSADKVIAFLKAEEEEDFKW